MKYLGKKEGKRRRGGSNIKDANIKNEPREKRNSRAGSEMELITTSINIWANE